MEWLSHKTCWVYLGCPMRNCIMRQQKDNIPCWEVEGTLCNHSSIQLAKEQVAGTKEDACIHSRCIYYKVAKKNAIT